MYTMMIRLCVLDQKWYCEYFDGEKVFWSQPFDTREEAKNADPNTLVWEEV